MCEKGEETRGGSASHSRSIYARFARVTHTAILPTRYSPKAFPLGVLSAHQDELTRTLFASQWIRIPTPYNMYNGSIIMIPG